MRSRTTTKTNSQDMGDAARFRLKSVAQDLFGERGIDGVSVRDIVAAAGMRNGASLHYYFGSKENLIRDLVIDSAKRSDSARVAALNKIEADGGPHSVREVVAMLVNVETKPQAEDAGGPAGFGHMRFIVALQFNHRDVMQNTLKGHNNIGYRRCLDHMRALLPHIPADILNQRFIYMYITLITTLAARETAFETDPTGGKLWSSPTALPNLITSLAAMVEADVQ